MKRSFDSTMYRDYVGDITAIATRPIERTYLDRRHELIQRLADAVANQRLTLMLGAGASVRSKLPDWKTVTERVIGEMMPGSADRVMARLLMTIDWPEARKFRAIGSLGPSFPLILRDALYRHYRHTSKNRVLATITEMLIQAHRKKRHVDVINYNVDDLLERHLTDGGLAGKFSVVYSPATYTTADRPIRIYHPHGFIPHDGAPDEILASALVFSEPQYHDSYFDHTYWANSAQRAVMQQTVCLFVGCSLNDPNMRRLLDQTRSNGGPSHVAVVRKCNRWKSRAKNQLLDFLVQHDLHSLGVSCLWVSSFDRVPKLLARCLL